jgi:hypothetical protein
MRRLLAPAAVAMGICTAGAVYLASGERPLPRRPCASAPAPLEVPAPERNLTDVETISNNLRDVTMNGICQAILARDLARVSDAFDPSARVERLFPRVETPVASSAAGIGTLVRPADAACHGEAGGLAEDLQTITQAWRSVERCFFKPYRILATTETPRRARVSLQFWLGGSEASGARVAEKGEVDADVVETQPGTWRFTRMAFGERERFRAPKPAFADSTTDAGLPTDWPDDGYETKDIFHGQVLYGGVSIGDVDGDGADDLYISRAGPNLLLRNDGTGHFTDVTTRAGVGDPGNSQSALLVDFDNDGDLDLLVINAYYSIIQSGETRRGHRLYRNDGHGVFTELPQRFDPIGPASGATAADFDGDGLVDLYITYYQDERLHPYHHFIEARDGFGNHLFRNLGGMRFVDVTETAGVASHGWSYASAWADYDQDGRIDLYVANDFGDSDLFRNRGDGTFEQVAAKTGVANPANGMSADWGDYDNDGQLDLYVANMYSKTGNQFLPLYPDLDETVRRKLLFSVQGNALYRAHGDGTFHEVGRALGASLAGWAWGSNFFDYDNDGWLDLHVANGFWAGEVDNDA